MNQYKDFTTVKSLFKTIYRYTHPRCFRHNETLWPYIKIKRTFSGEIHNLIYKRKNISLVKLSELKNAYDGDILLTATGPSINKLNFSEIPEIKCMGVNGAWALNKKVSFDFYIIVDMLFFDQKKDTIEEIVNKPNLILFTTAHGIKRILERVPHSRIKCKLSLIEDACSRIYKPKIEKKEIAQTRNSFFLTEKSTSSAFSLDIRQGIVDAGTVIYWALQLLSFMGFKRVIIAGLDMKNFDKPRFYESDTDKLPSFLHDKVASEVIPSFSLARKAFDSKGITICNLSQESAIDDEIFPKVKANEIF